MNRKMIIEALNQKGYKAEEQSTVKNGVIFEGIRIFADNNVAPVIYTDEILSRAKEEEMTLEEVVSTIIELYESHKSFQFDLEKFMSKDYILTHIYIGLQKASEEDLIKRESGFDGIESYLYIVGSNENENYSCKVNNHILEKAQITVEQSWEWAEKNTKRESTITSLASVISEMLGEDILEETDTFPMLYVVSNKSRIKGASAILNQDILSEFAKEYATKKILVLPSSIHEMLIIPYSEEMDIDYFSDMVREVNESQVAPEEQLTNRAYIITI